MWPRTDGETTSRVARRYSIHGSTGSVAEDEEIDG